MLAILAASGKMDSHSKNAVRWVLLLSLVVGGWSAPKVAKAGRTTALFDEPYKPDDSRHFDIQASSTFKPDPKKQFDLSYADGTELKGFNADDVVHVSIIPEFLV
jgi:hypothetical protein